MTKALKDMTVAELRSLAKGLKIGGASTLKKVEVLALITEFAMASRRVRAKAPMSQVDRIAGYVKVNGTAKLTAAQERQIRRMDRKLTAGRSTKDGIPNV